MSKNASSSSQLSSAPYFVAVDLGSNSFHMLIARENNGVLEVIDRVKDMVQIARGLKNGVLSEEAQERALTCLACFYDRIKEIPGSQIRAVGTKALRAAHNADDFLSKAEKTLGYPIQIVSGYEEARLVYLGVSHSISHDHRKRLVVDIGGGSTEFIIGQDYRPKLLESLSIGCVTYAEKYFQKAAERGVVTEKMMRNAYLEACEELELIRKTYRREGWNVAYGASGTMKVIAGLMPELTPTGVITKVGLESLYDSVIETGKVDVEGIPKLRRDVLPAGLAVLKAIFDQLKIQELHVSLSTLKEGLIYDAIGRMRHADIRDETVDHQLDKYRIEKKQGKRVKETALQLFSQLETQAISGLNAEKILSWAAMLHEIGLSLSHSGYHHHGRYLLEHGDLAGFNRYEQFLLATLVGMHRRKLSVQQLSTLNPEHRDTILAMVVSLRLAVLLNRRRKRLPVEPYLRWEDSTITLTFDAGWLEEHPLTLLTLEQESDYLRRVGLSLIYQ
ncbi:Ppx/GppA family phosphatase [Marinibactrum halimedae]|uniref:Exopolyphosphatase n=1 Tax=Marinibactrum halimedae TaxID=1444977 RepID=A0AA37TAG2_9GAMM|nr:Ppx/GppA family phosphatase [Marinibactrum halimedae]MCD9460641.1 Ppx/GppA family phosphatase [Marinibactrum halimedae]GLS27857.1 exopolyphosphatase [Marinibactrum halimedae]